MNDDWVTVGRIRTAFGVKGWLKVESFTEPAQNILDYGGWQLSKGKQVSAITVDEVALKQNQLLVHVKGIDDREAARQLANSLIQVPKSELLDLDSGDYYWHQLVGLQVFQASETDGESKLVGQVVSLLETGANDVLVVRPQSDKAEILIPYLPETVVKAVDLDRGEILVDWYYD